jgi:hypothetical protein
MADRTVEDRLREQYFSLLPAIQRVLWNLETEIRFHTLPILHKLQHYEKLVVTPRIKDCESAIKALRRRQEYGIFDRETPEKYSLLRLPDLAGVRVLVFPRSLMNEVDLTLRDHFAAWTPDPVPDGNGGTLAKKYIGHCTCNEEIRAEYQVVPMLIGLYWQVEHSAIYKPAPSDKVIKDKSGSEPLEMLNAKVVRALLDFEAEYERIVKD